MTTLRITEDTEIYNNPNSSRHGTEILTCTVWAGDEAIQSFGGCLSERHDEVRAQAAACANQYEGTTAAQIKAYDLFIIQLN